jgi:hypothetical protein
MKKFFNKHLLILAASFLFLVLGGWLAFNPVHLIKSIFAASNQSGGSTQPIIYNAQFSGVIGVQVWRNPNRLAPLDWYRSQNFTQGSPKSDKVDGFPALTEGSSIYVSAPNYKEGAVNPSAYVNVYLLSYGQGNDWTTKEIAKRLAANWKFLSTLPDNIAGGPATAKEQLSRDNERLTSLGTVINSLQKYHSTNGYYPDLSSGTFLPGHSVSAWPSWQQTLSKALNTSLPIDPLNTFNTSANGTSCAAAQGFESATCYASPGSVGGGQQGAYQCPDGSHVLEYTTLDTLNGKVNHASLYSNLEFKNIDWLTGSALGNGLVRVTTDNSCHSIFIDFGSGGHSWGQLWSQTQS